MINNDNYKYWPYSISKRDQRTGQITFTELIAIVDREFTKYGYGLSFQEDEVRPEEGKFSPIWNLTKRSERYNGPTFQPGTSVKVVLKMKPKPTSGFYYDIVDIDFSEVNKPSSISNPKTVSEVASRINESKVAPRRILSDPLIKEFQTSFKQSCQVPVELVRNIHYSNVEDSLVRLASQWRLDYSRAKHDSEDDLSILLGICDKVLNRGSISFCSPYIEQLVQMDVPSIEILPKFLSLLGPSKSENLGLSSKFDFDVYDHVSDEESMFMDILSSWTQSGQIDPWYIIPQIHISSLTNNWGKERESKADFLLTNVQSAGIVVEIDGSQHKETIRSDKTRDRALSRAGFSVVRISSSEIRETIKTGLNGKGLNNLLEKLRNSSNKNNQGEDFSSFSQFITEFRLYKWLHQIQISMMEGMRGGWLPKEENWVIYLIAPKDLSGIPNIDKIFDKACKELLNILTRLSNVTNLNFEAPKSIIVKTVTSFDQCVDPNIVILSSDSANIKDLHLTNEFGVYIVTNTYFPVDIEVQTYNSSPIKVQTSSREDATWFLNYMFRKKKFLDGQYEIVERVLGGGDTIALLPTGAGKSISFQLSAMLLPGHCLVVDPIVALIDDQLDNLSQYGIDRCVGIKRGLDRTLVDEYYNSLESGHYLFSYVAPERLQMENFREKLVSMTQKVPISTVIIDEAHCVSEWGHDFRTAYLNLARISRKLCSSKNQPPSLTALTGTASQAVLKDIQRELEIIDLESIIRPKTFNRSELNFTVLESSSIDKQNRLIESLSLLPEKFSTQKIDFFEPNGTQSNAGLIFCPHVNGSFGVFELSEVIKEQLNISTRLYSGSSPRKLNTNRTEWEYSKFQALKDFKRDTFQLMVCTSAFGMGIDKSNIRYTVHIGLPNSIESFYQQAGRAGRDGKQSECIIIVSNEDKKRTEKLLNQTTDIKEINKIVHETKPDKSDDVVRSLYFHCQTFKGIDEELSKFSNVLLQLGSIENIKLKIPVSFNAVDPTNNDHNKIDDLSNQTEKVLHRLVILGIVSDYRVDYSRQEFRVDISGASKNNINNYLRDYVSSYQIADGIEVYRKVSEVPTSYNYNDYIISVTRILLEFIYDRIERQRRISTSQILKACEEGVGDGEKLRIGILNFLEHSDIDTVVDKVIDAEYGGMREITYVLDSIENRSDVDNLRGSVDRAMTSYPTNPSLWILKATAECLSEGQLNNNDVKEPIKVGMRFAVEILKIGDDIVANGLADLIILPKFNNDNRTLIIESILSSGYCSPQLAKKILKRIGLFNGQQIAFWLLGNIITHYSKAD